MHRSCHWRLRGSFRSYGFSLLEMLLSLGLISLLIGCSIGMYRTVIQHHAEQLEQLEMANAAQTALQLMAYHLRLAGFTPPQSEKILTPIQACSSRRPLQTNRRNPVGCMPLAASDSMTVTYLADLVSTWPSRDGQPTDCLGQSLVSTGPSTRFAALASQRFFARPSPSTQWPELYCEGTGRVGIPQPMVYGIERLDLRYRHPGLSDFVSAEQIDSTQSANIDLVQICVTVRGQRRQASPGYIDCFGQIQKTKDGFPRAAFISWVAIRNAGSQ